MIALRFGEVGLTRSAALNAAMLQAKRAVGRLQHPREAAGAGKRARLASFARLHGSRKL